MNRYTACVSFRDENESDFYESIEIKDFNNRKKAIEFVKDWNNMQCDYPDEYEDTDLIEFCVWDNNNNKVVYARYL